MKRRAAARSNLEELDETFALRKMREKQWEKNEDSESSFQRECRSKESCKSSIRILLNHVKDWDTQYGIEKEIKYYNMRKLREIRLILAAILFVLASIMFGG